MHKILLGIQKIKLRRGLTEVLGTMIFLILGLQNGMAQNPKMLASPISIGSGRNIQQIVTLSNKKVFFSVVDNLNPGSADWGLWTTDGTAAGTVKLNLTPPGYILYAGTMLTPFGDKLILAGDNVPSYGEVWVTDGTSAGSVVLEASNIVPFVNTKPVMGITVAGNTAYYAIMTSDKHLQLKKTDGSLAGTSLVHDFGIYNQSMFAELTSFGNQVLFDFFDLDNGGQDIIYVSDGTDAGTVPLITLDPNTNGNFLESHFMQLGSKAYFMVGNMANSATLYQTDGTPGGTGPLKVINPTSYSTNNFPSFAVAGGLLYFAGNDGVNGKTVWRTDGTNLGTTMINGATLATNVANLVAINDTVYFSGVNGAIGNEFWKFDNSKSQPVLIRDIQAGATGSNPASITPMNNNLLLSASRTAAVGSEFWVSDGTSPNTIEIENINAGANLSSTPRTFAIVDDTAYFAADMDLNGDLLNDAVCIFKYVQPQKIWTGNISGDQSDPLNWFPQGVPTNAGNENLLFPSNAPNGMNSNIFLFPKDVVNNGTTITMGGGLLLMNGDFYNLGTIDNTLPGVFGIVNNGFTATHNAGSPGPFLGQLTISSQVNLQLTSNSYFPTFRVEGGDTVYLGDYSLKVDAFNIFTPKIVTNGSGALSLPVGATPVQFPVSSDGKTFTPVTITNHNGFTDYFSVNVKNGVQQGGTSGNFILGQVVNKTWDIHQLSANPSNADLSFQWTAADELPGFNRNTVNVSHFTGGSWDMGPVGAASGTDPFTYSRTGLTSFSPFAISSQAQSLPLKLVSITAIKSEQGISVNWLLASKDNLTSFDVERSSDGIHFEKIASVPANSSLSYSYLDQKASPNNNFYRIKAHESTGEFSYSRIVLVGGSTSGITLKLSPNPARDILNLQLNLSGQKANMRIVDMNGKILMQQNMSLSGPLSTSIDISKLSSGVYYMWVSDGSTTEVRKFIKQ
ncbi:MAG: hypothetical protein C5B52_16330 [Bacteroidetes bacterium]|nr:MAG: hypothetical protein C5B52_16330 [Bacteroidota bacterium]